MQRLNFLHRYNIPAKHLLERSDWANDFIETQFEILGPFFQPYLAPAGTVILKEGEKTNFFCLICDGSVDIVKENSAGHLKTLKTLGANKIIGEMAFLYAYPAAASVISKETSTLLIMSNQSYQALCASSPSIALVLALKFLGTISTRLREANGKLMDLL